MSTKKGIEIIKTFKMFLSTTKSFDQCLNALNLVSGGNGRVLAEFTVGQEHLNRRGTLHGGFIAMLVDSVTTCALRTNDHIESGGVSVNMHISYLSSAKEGDNLEIEASTVKAGKSMAFLEIVIRNKDKNTILATGNHTKYLA